MVFVYMYLYIVLIADCTVALALLTFMSTLTETGRLIQSYSLGKHATVLSAHRNRVVPR